MQKTVKSVGYSLGLLVLASYPLANANAATKVTKPTKATTTKTTAKTPAKTTTTTTPAPITSSNTGSALTPILSEPTLTDISYPKAQSLSLRGTNLTNNLANNVPVPSVSISDVAMLSTVMISKSTADNSSLDVSILDDFLKEVSPKARHYPPVFTNPTDRYNSTQRVKQLTAWIENYAQDSNASYDVLLRAAKINAIGRNLDLGSDYAVRAGNYVARAIRINDTAEANFLYGMMLAEGGGFKEGSKYLEKAESMGYREATQSLAQADLLDDKKDRALQRLTQFKAKYPTDPMIDEQLRIVNSGQYYIWKLPLGMMPAQ
ncbi:MULTISPECIES: sel1 repeat family protein [unclassified Moraxella]|uniref:sel1 repeat family protein n=1 Tax=unclassified Moraxella TaxID=2685852 RepID=UPI003AF53083